MAADQLGDEDRATALIYRLMHHCYIVSIRGNNGRMREFQDLLRFGSEECAEGTSSGPPRALPSVRHAHPAQRAYAVPVLGRTSLPLGHPLRKRALFSCR